MSIDLAMLLDHNSREFNVTIAVICGLMVLGVHMGGVLSKLSTLVWRKRMSRRKARAALRPVVPVGRVAAAAPRHASEPSGKQPDGYPVSA